MVSSCLLDLFTPLLVGALILVGSSEIDNLRVFVLRTHDGSIARSDLFEQNDGESGDTSKRGTFRGYLNLIKI